MYIKSTFLTLKERILEPKRFIQVVSGPRQVGKTTGIRQILTDVQKKEKYLFLSADEPTLKDNQWLKTQWKLARLEAKESFILIIDEIQKIPQWSETVKSLWDEDIKNNIPLKVILLGSSSMLIHKGLSESLTGRFEVNRISHWSYEEMKAAFGFNLEEWVFFGGYPGAAPLKNDLERWKSYIRDSIIDPTLSLDILQMERIEKPALLKRLFELSSLHTSQILSYQKMLGQIQDVGNSSTLAHYLQLLSQAGLISGLEKYSESQLRQKASSPKLQIQNNALLSALDLESLDSLFKKPERWGRWIESSVGVHLLNQLIDHGIQLHYWRHKNFEVDFVLSKANKSIALEVKSGKTKNKFNGLKEFKKYFPNSETFVIGTEGIPFEKFFQLKIIDLFKL